MGMDWLRGLVGASDQMIPAGQQGPGGAPWGQSPYAPPPSAYSPPGPPLGGVPQGGASAWTPPAAAVPAGPSLVGAAPGSGDPQVAELQAQCAQLRKDVDSIALFARTLLALLEEKQIVTEAQFQEAKKKIDGLDGKLDDRVG